MIAGAAMNNAGAQSEAPQKPAEKSSTTETAKSVELPAKDKARQTQLDAWAERLEEIETLLKAGNLTAADLDELRGPIDKIAADSDALLLEIRPELRSVEARLVELKPAEGTTVETEGVKAERERQENLQAALSGILKQANVVQLRSNELVNALIRIRQRQITEQILTSTRSIVSPDLWVDVIAGLPRASRDFTALISGWLRGLANQYGIGALIGLLASFVGAYFIAYPLRKRLLDRAARDPEITHPTPVQRSTAGLNIALLAAIVPAATLYGLYLALDVLELTPPRIDAALKTIINGILFFAIAHGTGRAILAVNRPGWRLIRFDDKAAESFQNIVIALGLVLCVGWIIDGMAVVLRAPLALLTASAGVFAALIAILILVMLRIVLRGQTSATDPSLLTAARIAFRWYVPAAGIGALACLLAVLTGYISLGWFIANQLVWILAILAMLHIALLFVDDALTGTFRDDNDFGGMIRETLGITGPRIIQFGVVCSGVVRIMLIVAAVLLILAPWGVNTRDFSSIGRHVLSGFSIGEFTFSPVDLLIAGAILIIGLAISRGLQRWLSNRFLPQTDLDVGLQTSIHTAFGYIGFIVVAVVAFSYIGLDLQNIALVAGALSVGIGFGLQSIVNNFVSGLILLAERPIKVGDWIVVGAEQGYVSRINVRATEIQTFDRAAVIVPNSDLISGVVKNWMHRGKIGRVRLPVGVSYDSDPEEVKALLLSCVEGEDQILSSPAPVVYFVSFGDSSLDFELRVFLRNIDSSLKVSSALRFKIIQKFRQAGIEIPFPQRDINLRDIDKLEHMVTPGNAEPEKK